MRSVRVVGLIVLTAIAACGGGKSTATSPTPTASGATRALTAMDPSVSPIAKAAAMSLERGSNAKMKFGGVFVSGRELVALGDTIAKAIGADRAANDGRVPYAICRVGSPGCGAGAMPNEVTYSFKSLRARGDTAYVGTEVRNTVRADEAICIKLAHTGSAWLVAERREVGNWKNCG